MNKIFTSLTGILALSSVALACEPTTPQPSIFNGLKVGGNLGVGFGKARHRFYGAALYGSQNNDLGIVGIDGGISLGYDHVFENTALLLGVEGDINWSGAQGFQRYTLPSGTILRTKAARKHAFQGKARVGYVMDKTVIYGVIGVDVARWDFENSLSGVGSNNQNKYLTGLITGGGIETYVSQKVSVGVEYNNYAYNAQSFVIPGSSGSRTTLNPHHHKVMATVKYTF